MPKLINSLPALHSRTKLGRYKISLISKMVKRIKKVSCSCSAELSDSSCIPVKIVKNYGSKFINTYIQLIVSLYIWKNLIFYNVRRSHLSSVCFKYCEEVRNCKIPICIFFSFVGKIFKKLSIDYQCSFSASDSPTDHGLISLKQLLFQKGFNGNQHAFLLYWRKCCGISSQVFSLSASVYQQ